MERIKVLIKVDCGLVYLIGSTAPIDLVVLDYDTQEGVQIYEQENPLMTEQEIQLCINAALND